MKRILTIILTILTLSLLVILIASYVIVGDNVTSERSIYVEAPPPISYSNVVNLRRWELWSPWMKMDPDMTLEYVNNGIGKDASYEFSSKLENMGSGELIITDTHKDKSIQTHLLFNDSEGFGSWDFTQKGKGSVITWQFSFKPNGLKERVMGLFFDRMMGKNLEDGLNNLKELCEKTPPRGFDVEASLKKKMKEVKDSIINARRKLKDSRP